MTRLEGKAGGQIGESLAKRESLRRLNLLLARNASPEAYKNREDRMKRLRKEGFILALSCVDARLKPADTLDPGYGPVLDLINSYAGASPVCRQEWLLNQPDLRGYVAVSHWDDSEMMRDQCGFAGEHISDVDGSYHLDDPGKLNEEGLPGCGARKGAHILRCGQPLGITGEPYIAEHVSPHCIGSALQQAMRVSTYRTDIPCYAMGISHITQRPYLLGIAKDGRWDVVVPDIQIADTVPEIDPRRIEDKYPHIAAMVNAGRQVANSQTYDQMTSRLVQNPWGIWVRANTHSERDVFPGTEIGELMSISYHRESREQGYRPRPDELLMIQQNISYGLHMASQRGHGFHNTRGIIIDGKSPDAVIDVWRKIKETREAQYLISKGELTVMGAVMIGGVIKSYKILHN